MSVAVMNKNERNSVFIGLLQDIHTMRAELNRLEKAANEMKEVDSNDSDD